MITARKTSFEEGDKVIWKFTRLNEVSKVDEDVEVIGKFIDYLPKPTANSPQMTIIEIEGDLVTVNEKNLEEP